MWTVYANNKLLYASGIHADSGHILINPVISKEINSAGSFTCGVPLSNELYSSIRLMTTTIEVYKDEKIQWRGRPLSVDIGYNKTMNITCEGALSYLNDTVYPPDTCTVRLGIFLKKLIANHNKDCETSRQIHIGTVTMDDIEIEWNNGYTQTMEVLKTLVDTYGGYLIARSAEGGDYFDWLKELPTDASQAINVENVIDISKAISAEDVVTCVIPVGKESLTIGTGYIENTAAVALFGRIWKYVEFTDIEDPDELYNAGEEYLNNNLWSSMQLDLTASNLTDIYEVGKMYHAIIPSFGIRHDIALTGSEISLVESGQSKFTFSAATIWTQINSGKDISQVIDSTQKLKLASSATLSARTAKLEAMAEKETFFTGDIQFSNGTTLSVVRGMISGGKSTEGDF